MAGRLTREDEKDEAKIVAAAPRAPVQTAPEARILALQHGAGNAAVARMLGRGHAPVIARAEGDQAAPPGLVPAIAALDAVIEATLAGGNPFRLVIQAESKLQRALSARPKRGPRTGLDDALEAALGAVRAARGGALRSTRAGATVDELAVAALTAARDALRGHLPAPAPQPAPRRRRRPNRSRRPSRSRRTRRSRRRSRNPRTRSVRVATGAGLFVRAGPPPPSAPASSSAIDWDSGSWIPNISNRPSSSPFPPAGPAAKAPFRFPPAGGSPYGSSVSSTGAVGSSVRPPSSDSPYAGSTREADDATYAGNVPAGGAVPGSPADREGRTSAGSLARASVPADQRRLRRPPRDHHQAPRERPRRRDRR